MPQVARWKVVTIVALASTAGLAAYVTHLQDELQRALDSLEEAAARVVESERTLRRERDRVRALEEDRLSAEEQAALARERAQSESQKASSAGKLAVSLRSEAATAQEQARRRAAALEAASERTASLEQELAESRRKVEEALARVRAAEEGARRAEAVADGDRQALAEAREREAAARTELQRVERSASERLELARKAVAKALKRYDHALAGSQQADNALRLALRNRPAGDDALDGAGRLHDYYNLRDRSEKAAEEARKSLRQALEAVSRP